MMWKLKEDSTNPVITAEKHIKRCRLFKKAPKVQAYNGASAKLSVFQTGV